jgi:hypothetical protein
MDSVSHRNGFIPGNPTEEEERLSTFDLLIKLGCFEKGKLYINKIAAGLN